MRSRAGSYASGGDDGFTLVELLLAIIIIGVITVPLANVVIGYFHNTDTTTERLLRSHDVQIASAFWEQDVASIGQRNAQRVLQPSIQPPAMTSESHCTSTGTIATFTWDEFANATDPATVVTVAYRVTYDSASHQCELHRVRSTSSTTDVVLVHHLNPATSPNVTCYLANSNSTDCTTVPTANEVVKLNLSLTDPGSQAGVWGVTLRARADRPVRGRAGSGRL